MPFRALLALFALAPLATAQATHFVDAGAPPGGSGATWGAAFDDLADALAVATAGDEVWVAAGTYFGGFDVPDGVAVLGGFLPGQRWREERRPKVNVTVLDGQQAQRVVRVGDAVLDGFTVQNGRAFSVGGGGAVVNGTSPVIRDCLFTGNTNAGGRGSTLYVRNGGDPLVQNCVFYKNGDFLSGHTIDVFGANGTFEHVTVYDNIENGMHIDGGSAPVIRNSIFALNQGRGICHITAADTPTVENVLFFANSVSLMHVMGSELHTVAQVNALSYATDNVEGDPLFVNGAAGDVRLTPGSPAVDAGHAGAVPSAADDAFDNPRVLDGDLDGVEVADIGAHELAHVELDVTGPFAPGSTVGFTATGAPGMTLQVWIGATPSPTVDPPFGTAYFNLAARRRMIAKGAGPLAGSFKIPGLLPAGTPLVFQARAVDASGQLGTWGNAIRVLAD